MRKILPILIVATVLLTPLYPVYAQTTTPVKRIAKPNTASAAAKLDAARERLEDKKEAVAGRIDAIKDKMASRSAELKAKLAKFRDKTKAARVENINTNLNALNKRHTEQMSNSLTRISTVLTKLKTWVAEQEAAGKDVASLKSAISETEAAWTAADAAVKDQADNDYTIVVNTESTVRVDAQTARDTLRTDLKSVHDKLINVKQTLATALSSWKGGN